MPREIHIPPREKPDDDNGYFEVLTQAVFQAGFSWQVVRDKWANFRRAFDGFDRDAVARYDTRDIDRLVADEGIVRNARKIEATIENARIMQTIIGEHGSFEAYLRSLDGLSYEERRKALAGRFKWLGRTGIFFFLWSVDEPVPDWENR
jgi:DNA-3-methyladenine glycosylase I